MVQKQVVQHSALMTGLPKKTDTLCPECLRHLVADVYDDDGKVMMKKTCPEHGEFLDTYYSDTEMFLKMERFARDGIGVENPAHKNVKSCPEGCGLCNLHKSHTNIANVDLTNRCNLKCPVCFANANAAGYVYEPDLDVIKFELAVLRSQKPVPTTAIQFAGGEPTIYPHFLDAIRYARDIGFSQIQVATNGILLAKKPQFAQQMFDAGMHTIYLQFDGFKQESYVEARGFNLLPIKYKAIENCRQTSPIPLTVVLVPTLLNTINDDQVGQMAEFAIENNDVIRGVNYQPVSITGRIDYEERMRYRFTLADLAHRLEDQTRGKITKDDWYPVPLVAPLSNLVSAITGHYKPAFTVHPHCGTATFLYVDEEKNYTPVTRFIDVEGMFLKMEELARKANTKSGQLALSVLKKGSGVRKGRTLAKAFKHLFGEFVDENKCPEDFDIYGLLGGVASADDKKGTGQFCWSTTYLGGMHFQDLYNYDLERLMRCTIHYTAPDGRIYPFCAYNCGPSYRHNVEKLFSVPMKGYKVGDPSVTLEDIATRFRNWSDVPIVQDAQGNWKVDFEDPGPQEVDQLSNLTGLHTSYGTL